MNSIKLPTGRRRGFTLVELMIVVAIIGVLAALAIYGVKRYLSTSKAAEAKQTVGAIARGAAAAYEEEKTDSELLSVGSSAAHGSGGTLCASAAATVPATLASVTGKKYQPDSAATADFNKDSASAGWRCIKFSMSQPITYRYGYKSGAANPVAGGNTCGTTDSFYATAEGDTDGNQAVASFSRCGKIDNNKALVLSTQLNIVAEAE